MPAFWSLHLGIALTLKIGVFPYVSIVSWLVMLPPEIPEGVLRKFSRLPAAAASAVQIIRSLVQNARAAAPWPFRPSRANQAVAAFFLAYTTIWNLCWLPYLDLGRHFPRGLLFLGQVLQVEQHWNLFAPAPLIRDGWFVVPGVLADGTEVDLFRGGRPPTWGKPAELSSLWPNSRWWMYTMRLAEYDGARIAYSGWLCNAWNERNQKQRRLVSLDIYFLFQDTLPNHSRGPIKKNHVWTAKCNVK